MLALVCSKSRPNRFEAEGPQYKNGVLQIKTNIIIAHADNVGQRGLDYRVRLFVCLSVCLFVRRITQKRMIPKCSNSV